MALWTTRRIGALSIAAAAWLSMIGCSGGSPKPAFKLLASVQQLWDEIRFTTPDGKRIDYTAVLETDFGPIEIALRPDVAPNHVRSFVALVRAGYYDGMRFDHIHHEVSADAPN